MTLQRVAHALSEVPGRVFVVGHTDDQPLRSLRYRDNFDLSRARADEVVKLLALAIDNAARLEPSGVGSSEPRYKPESLPRKPRAQPPRRNHPRRRGVSGRP